MIDWTMFIIFVFVGYVGTRVAVGRRAGPQVAGPQVAEPPALSAGAPPNIDTDPACRLILGSASEDESALLRSKCKTDPEFAHTVEARRRELIRDYAAGGLPPRARELFRAAVLQQPGVAQEVEVERALAAVADPEFGRLGTKLTYKLRAVDSVWRKLTLPPATAPAEGTGAGPCLMIGPEAESDTVELAGTVTAVSEDEIEVNLGIRQGLGPGDFVHIDRGDSEWIGTAVITSSDEAKCRAVFMGEGRPIAGDRAKAILEGDAS